MARYQKQRTQYPMGSVSTGTMRPEDLIPAFLSELEYRLKHGPKVSRETRKRHFAMLRNVRMEEDYWDSEQPNWDLDELLDALNEYVGPYFYFGAHPGDGSDYGYWLSDGFEDGFVDVETFNVVANGDPNAFMGDGLKVSDTSEIPSKYCGNVLVVNDHGNVTLYVKTSRTLREIWAIV